MKLDDRWALPVYPVFYYEKSNGLDKNLSSEKLYKKTNRSKIIATNFVWEQLIRIKTEIKHKTNNFLKKTIVKNPSLLILNSNSWKTK